MELISRESALTLINDIRNRYMIMIKNYAMCIGLDAEKMQKDAYEDIGNRIDELLTVDAIPLGCLELEKRDCGFSDQCDMGSSYTRERERACKNIIEWWKTPSYQKCLRVATERGFVSKKW